MKNPSPFVKTKKQISDNVNRKNVGMMRVLKMTNPVLQTVYTEEQDEEATPKAVEGVQQEFYASTYLVNFLASAAYDVQEDIQESRKDKENKYEYKANLNELVGILKDELILAIAQDSVTEQTVLINEILDEAKRFVVPIRPYRTVHRNPNPRTSDFHHNHKVNC